MTAAAQRVLTPFWYAVLAAPAGTARGFVGVTLAFYLRQHGVPFAAIAGMVGFVALPFTWKILIGPFVDAVSTPTRWFVLSVAVIIGAIVGLGFGAHGSVAMPMMGALALVAGAAAATSTEASVLVMVQNSPTEHRGTVAGWLNAGQLGGGGIGGGAALWIASATSGGIAIAGLAMGLATALCIAPLLWLRLPRVARGETLAVRGTGVWRALAGLLRSRVGWLVALFSLAPTGLNEAANLMPAVAGEWHAPAGMVALVSGVLNGVATIPGCLVGGWLCRRFSPKAVYIATSAACALVEVVIAWSPQTPTTFAGLVLLNAVIVGSNWAGITGVVFEILGEEGAATVSSLLSSLANAPIVVMAMVVGQLQQHFGSRTMFLGEAAIAGACLVGLTVLMVAWRARPAVWPMEATAQA
jgi:PAT family beta-lactamase induction signal transducer AmpG